jgi:D-tyrosyl-tRNA(Tyr) deacylase
MLALIQRVLDASVSVESEIKGIITNGLLVFLGVSQNDEEVEAKYLASKVLNCRIFNDNEGKMNLSLLDKEYEILVISQFTLHAETRHGNRPSFTEAAEPKKAEQLYNYFITELKSVLGPRRVQEGVFGAMMKVKLLNDGPVTILLKSKNEFE